MANINDLLEELEEDSDPFYLEKQHKEADKLFEKEKIQKLIDEAERHEKKRKNPFYARYDIPEKCPDDFWAAFNCAKKVPYAKRPYQNLVRDRFGTEHFEPAYFSPKDVKEMKNYLIKKFPKNKEDIKKLKDKTKEQRNFIKFIYHSIRGVYG